MMDSLIFVAAMLAACSTDDKNIPVGDEVGADTDLETETDMDTDTETETDGEDTDLPVPDLWLGFSPGWPAVGYVVGNRKIAKLRLHNRTTTPIPFPPKIVLEVIPHDLPDESWFGDCSRTGAIDWVLTEARSPLGVCHASRVTSAAGTECVAISTVGVGEDVRWVDCQIQIPAFGHYEFDLQEDDLFASFAEPPDSTEVCVENLLVGRECRSVSY